MALLGVILGWILIVMYYIAISIMSILGTVVGVFLLIELIDILIFHKEDENERRDR